MRYTSDAAYMEEWARGFVKRCEERGVDPEHLFEKTALMPSAFETISNAAGGGLGGAAAGIGAYSLPIAGVGLSAYDTLASGVNMFAPNQTMGQRLGHGVGMLGNAAVTGISALTGGFGGGLARTAVQGIGRGLSRLLPGVAAKMAPAAATAGRGINAATRGIQAGAKKALPAGAQRYLLGNTGWQQNMKNWGQGMTGLGGMARRAAGAVGASPITHVLGGAALSGLAAGAGASPEQMRQMQQGYANYTPTYPAYYGGYRSGYNMSGGMEGGW